MKHLSKKGCGIALAAAMSLTCLAGGGALIANAAENNFDYTSLANRTWIGGVTQEKITAAMEEEATRLKGEMTAAEQGDQFSIAAQPLANGWEGTNGGWQGAGTGFVAAHLGLGTFDSGATKMWSGGYAFIVYNPHMDKAFTVRGDMLNVYGNLDGNWGGHMVTHAGYPVANQFTVGGTDYQQFGLGYAKGEEFVYGKKVDASGVESDLTLDDVVKGLIIPVYQDTASANEILKLTVSEMDAAYKAYYTGKDLNFAPARQNNSWKNSTWRQEVVEEDEVVGNVVYNSARKAMFTVKTFLEGYNATDAWGNPTADEATAQGVTYQQFSEGVVVLEEGQPHFYAASHVNPGTGEVESDVGGSLVGAVQDVTAGKLPSGVTADAVKTAIEAKYDADTMGDPNGYVVFETDPFGNENTGYLKQSYTKGEDTTVLYLDLGKTPLAAVTLKPAAYADYKQPTRFNEGLKVYPVTGEMVLGPALGDEFTAGSKTYQNFLYGAMELSAKKPADCVLPGVNFAADGKRTVLDLSQHIKLGSNDIRIPTRYNIGAADLLKKFKDAYKEYAAAGIALGMPNKEGIGVWFVTGGGQEDGTNEFKDDKGEVTKQGMIKLGLHMTDSNAICYYGVTAMLAYSPKDGKVYIMKDSVISNMATYYCFFGAPTSNLTDTTLTVEGDEVPVQIQNFELGYLTVMGDSAAMTNDKIWDFNLRGAVNLDGSKIPGTVYPGEQSTTPGGTTPGGTTPGGTTPGGSGEGSGDEEDGCGSVIGGVGIGVTLGVLALGAALLVLRKRRE